MADRGNLGAYLGTLGLPLRVPACVQYFALSVGHLTGPDIREIELPNGEAWALLLYDVWAPCPVASDLFSRRLFLNPNQLSDIFSLG